MAAKRRQSERKDPVPAAAQASPQQAAKLRQAAKRKARGSALTVVMVIALIALITLMAIRLVWDRNTAQPALQFIYDGRIETVSNANALIIRDELLLTGYTPGTVRPAITEGSHVSAGQTVASVIDHSLVDTLLEISSYEEQIAGLQLQLIAAGQGSGARQIFRETDDQLRPLINQMRRNAASGEMGQNSALQDAVDILLASRQQQLQSVDFNDAMLSQLLQERDRLTQRLSSHAQDITAPQAGLISFRSDGLEDELTPDKVTSLTAAQVDEYLQLSGDMDELSDEVAGLDPLAREILGVWQYLAMTFDNVPVSWFEDHPVFTLTARDQAVTVENCQLVKAAAEGEGSFVIVKTDQRLGRLSGERSTAVRLATQSVSGLKVPLQALYNRNETLSEADLMQVSGGYARRVPVNVLAYDADSAIIEPKSDEFTMQQGSVIVTNPAQVDEGSAING